MHCRTLSIAALVALFATSRDTNAQEVRYYQDPNTGHTIRETNTSVHRQMPVTQLQPSSRTVLRGQWRTDTHDVVRTYSVPITDYRTETYWQNRFNPFVQPTLATRTVPYTRYETRTEVTKVPVSRYETVPTTETVHVPVTTWHTVQDNHVQRVVVAPAGTNGSQVVTATPAGSTIGGMARLDPPPSISGDSSVGTSGGSKTALSR